MNSTLRSLLSDQEDFRRNDRDGNGKQDYWRKDVAGLYGLKVNGKLIKNTELSRARADLRSVVPGEEYADKESIVGYWLGALRFENEEAPDPDRFALCAYPEDYGDSGTSTYIMSQDGIVFKKDLGHGKGLETYPSDPLNEGWIRLN